MRFTTRLILYTAAPTLLFVLALATSWWGLMRTQDDFNRYIGTEQAIVSGLKELYTQGLQGELAIRNIVLVPGNNNPAYKNRRAAMDAYTQAYDDTLRHAQGTPLEAPLRVLAQQRSQQIATQNQIIELANSDVAGATAIINQQETPIWRAMRAILMEQISVAHKTAAQAHTQTQERADRVEVAFTVLALVAVLTAVVLGVLMARTLHRELGVAVEKGI